jgi:hypothetical protein
MDLLVGPTGFACDAAEQTGRRSGYNGVGLDVLGNHCAGSDNRALANANAVDNDDASADPSVVVYENALGGYSLVDNWSTRIIEDVIDGKQLNRRGKVHAVADVYAALTSNYAVLPYQAIVADSNARVRQASKVVDVKNGTMHDEGTRS